MSSSINEQEADRRRAERRETSGGDVPEHGERREFEQRGVATAMVDALEDILRWERASERALRVAAEAAQQPSTAPSHATR